MNALRTLRLPLILALVAVVGIVGMLLLEGLGNGTAFVLASLPLAFGLWAWVSQREPRRDSKQ